MGIFESLKKINKSHTIFWKQFFLFLKSLVLNELFGTNKIDFNFKGIAIKISLHKTIFFVWMNSGPLRWTSVGVKKPGGTLFATIFFVYLALMVVTEAAITHLEGENPLERSKFLSTRTTSSTRPPLLFEIREFRRGRPTILYAFQFCFTLFCDAKQSRFFL